MEFIDNTVNDINIAYIGGGSKNWTLKLMADLACESSLSGTVKLYDIDFDSASLNESIGNSLCSREDVKRKWKYKAVRNIEEALDGADFVIISILPGTLVDMISDVHVPEKYGIYQSVGDTTGPGGIMRALRAIPIFAGFAQKIKEHCPAAWVINLSNPMALCVRTLYKVFPNIKAFGCCHEVYSVKVLLSDMLYELKGINDVPANKIKVNVSGINHFTWIDKASYNEIDLMPLFEEFTEKYYDEGYIDSFNRALDPEQAEYFRCANRVKFDLFRKYKLIAAAGDRHLAEFMPPLYLKNPQTQTVALWKFALTPVSFRLKQHYQKVEKYRKIADGEKSFEISRSTEEIVNQIKALLGLEDIITNVNLPNKGQMQGIQMGAVVETNALFSRNGVQPIVAGKLPMDVHNLIMNHVTNQEIILKAALNRDKELAFKAFMNDPLVNIHENDARKLFDEMLANIKEHLQGWNI